jgi:hypothetical protein
MERQQSNVLDSTRGNRPGFGQKENDMQITGYLTQFDKTYRGYRDIPPEATVYLHIACSEIEGELPDIREKVKITIEFAETGPR